MKVEEIRNKFKNKDRIEIRFSGTGGQGMILGAIILGEAVGLYEDKHVTQTQSYGPEARGGATKSDVVISDNEIYYPKSTKLDLLLAMSQEACDNYVKDLKPDGILVVDSFYVKHLPKFPNIFEYPITKIARDDVGLMVTANIVALGIICKLTGIVSEQALENAILERVPEWTKDVNLKALKAGMDLVK